LNEQPIISNSPPPPPILNKIEIPPQIEIYSCGSMGTIGEGPTRKVATILVRNTDYAGSAALTLTITGGVDYRFQGENNQILEEDETRSIELYAYVGTPEDPYPDFALSGIVEVVLNQGLTKTRKTSNWFYKGNV
jgi:hypothetical protein